MCKETSRRYSTCQSTWRKRQCPHAPGSMYQKRGASRCSRNNTVCRSLPGKPKVRKQHRHPQRSHRRADAGTGRTPCSCPGLSPASPVSHWRAQKLSARTSQPPSLLLFCKDKADRNVGPVWIWKRPTSPGRAFSPAVKDRLGDHIQRTDEPSSNECRRRARLGPGAEARPPRCPRHRPRRRKHPSRRASQEQHL